MNKYQLELTKQPVQARAKFTVSIIIEAATHILKELGYEKFTTNKVANRAGVSIGSLYQYFPSKESLVAEIKRQHFSHLRHLMQQAYVSTQGSPLAEVSKAFIQASVEAHEIDPQLHRILSEGVPELPIKEDDQSADSSRNLVIQLLKQHQSELREGINLTLAAKLIHNVVENMVHDTVLYEPHLLTESDFVNELVLIIMSYLTAAKTST